MRPATGKKSASPKAAGPTLKTKSRGAVRPAKAKAGGARKASGRAGAKITTNHDLIKRWAEQRGGTPATVTSTAAGKQPGILRIDFPGYRGKDTLKPIPWAEWFRKFDQKGLAFLYQERTAAGKPSRFFKTIQRSS